MDGRMSRRVAAGEGVLLLAVLGVVFGLAAGEVHSFDIFWQLQSGKYLFETGRFIRTDLFSLAADVPRWEHCWLHDLLFYGAFRAFGYAGVSLLKGVVVTSAALALVAAARVRRSSTASILLVLPAPLLMTFWAWKERPQLWTFLLLGLFLLVLERHRRQGGRGVWLLVPLMVLWSNLHAGAILAFPVAAAYVVGMGVERWLGRAALDRRDYLRLCISALLLLPAALATPYGREIFVALLYAPKLGVASGALAQIYNVDWAATTFRGYPLYFYAMAAAAFLLLLGRRSAAFSDLLLLAGLAVMGLKLERHTPLFLFAAAALLPAYADSAARLISCRLTGMGTVAARVGVLLLAVGLAVYFARPVLRDNGFFNVGLRQWHYPVEEADFVKRERLPGNLFNPYGAGGYLMWRLFPDYLVFWDGRQDSAEMFQLGLHVQSGRADWQQILDRFKVNTVISEACSQVDGARFPLVDRLTESPAWALVFAGESHLVYVRRSAVGADWLAGRELPASSADSSVLSAALALSRVSPLRPQAYWEMARVYLARRDYGKAREALQVYLAVTPAAKRVAGAEQYLRMLTTVGGAGATGQQ